MTSTTDTLPFVIEQTTGANPIKVTLADHDAPFGAARKGGMFELGGENMVTEVRLDGRQSPIIHTKYTVWTPTVIKGHIRDHFTGVDGHGQKIVNDLQDILDAQQPVKGTCGPWTWSLFPKMFKPAVEGLNDFTYELHFTVLSRPGQKAPPPNDGLINPFPTDLTSEIAAILTEQHILLLAQQLAVDALVVLNTMLDSLDNTLTTCISATAAFETADLPALAEAVAMSAAAASVSSSCDDVTNEIAVLDPATALTTTDDASAASFQAAAFAMMSILDECRARMWSVRYTANKRIRAVSTIYVVAKGDTPDSIAQQQLGSAARASDLKLRQQDLVPNRRIRIPAR